MTFEEIVAFFTELTNEHPFIVLFTILFILIFGILPLSTGYYKDDTHAKDIQDDLYGDKKKRK